MSDWSDVFAAENCTGQAVGQSSQDVRQGQGSVDAVSPAGGHRPQERSTAQPHTAAGA